MTYYELLQINPDASIEIIKAAYKAMSKKYHPDIYNDNGEMMRKINEAYDVLSVPEKRKRYDEKIKNSETSKSSHLNENWSEVSETKKSKSESDDNEVIFEKQGIVVKIIGGIIYLLGSGIFYILELALGLGVILFIIGFFTGHSQVIVGKIFEYITNLIG